jgi:hypothetical protein
VWRGLLPQHVVEPNVDEQSVPETLEEMENEALLSIQNTTENNVAIHEIQERPSVQRHAIPQPFAPHYTLIRVAEERGLYEPRVTIAATRKLFSRV